MNFFILLNDYIPTFPPRTTHLLDGGHWSVGARYHGHAGFDGRLSRRGLIAKHLEVRNGRTDERDTWWWGLVMVVMALRVVMAVIVVVLVKGGDSL